VQYVKDWRVNAEWEKTEAGGGTLTLTSMGGYSLLYDAAGGVPATEYTGPLTLASTSAISFRVYAGVQPSPFTHDIDITFAGAVSPDTFDLLFGEFDQNPYIDYSLRNFVSALPQAGTRPTKS